MAVSELEGLVTWFKANVLNDVYPKSDSNDKPKRKKRELTKAQIAKRDAKEDAKEERLIFKYILGLN